MFSSFTALLRSSARTLRAHAGAVLVGALIFGTLLAAAQWQIGGVLQERAWMAAQGTGFDKDRFEELGRRMEAGDQTAMDEMVAMLEEGLGEAEGMAPEERDAFYERKGKEMFLAIAPMVALAIAAWAAVMLLSSTYFLVLGIRGGGAGQLATTTLRSFVPLLGVWFWAMLRSFIWIPVIGLIPAIILGPRFALAGVLYLREGLGVRASVQRSYERTEGFWGTILGSMLALGILLLIVLVIVGTVTTKLTEGYLLTKLLIDAVVQQGIIAFYAFFLIHLTATVLSARPAAKATSAKKTARKK